MLVQSKIVSLLDTILGQTGYLRKGGVQLTYHCPFCPDKNPITRKLEIAIDGPFVGNFHCWRCNVKGRSFGSLLYKLKAPATYREQFHAITGDVRLLRKNVIKYELLELKLPDEFHPMATPLLSREYKNAMTYLTRRNISKVDIVRYNIGFCEYGQYAAHIIIPSYDAKGNLNFFIGRRYYNAKCLIPHKKPEVSMNIIGFECFINWNEPITLVEGAFDALAVRINAIPLFGKYLQPKLLNSIKLHNVKRINIILDNDAMPDAIENYKQLKALDGDIQIHIIKLDGKDPSVLGYDKIHALIRESTPFDLTRLIAERLKI